MYVLKYAVFLQALVLIKWAKSARCSNARASPSSLFIYIGVRTSLQSRSPGHCNGPILPINLFIVTEQVKSIQLSLLHSLQYTVLQPPLLNV